MLNLSILNMAYDNHMEKIFSSDAVKAEIVIDITKHLGIFKWIS